MIIVQRAVACSDYMVVSFMDELCYTGITARTTSAVSISFVSLVVHLGICFLDANKAHCGVCVCACVCMRVCMRVCACTECAEWIKTEVVWKSLKRCQSVTWSMGLDLNGLNLKHK